MASHEIHETWDPTTLNDSAVEEHYCPKPVRVLTSSPPCSCLTKRHSECGDFLCYRRFPNCPRRKSDDMDHPGKSHDMQHTPVNSRGQLCSGLCFQCNGGKLRNNLFYPSSVKCMITDDQKIS